MRPPTPTTVAPASLSRELRAVAPFAAAVLAAWALGVAAQRTRGGGEEGAAPPWQRSYLELSGEGQRLYREVREGLLEAENARAATKAWPTPEALAADGVPPFAADGLAAPLQWTQRQHGVYVNYLGTPADGRGTRWLVLFIEPEAGLLGGAPAPPPVDEEHHTLPDGTALHVTVWTQDAAQPAPSQVLAFPVAEGWVQRVGR